MSLVKRIIDCVGKPFTYICNQSLKTAGIETAESPALCKAGDCRNLSNYRPVSLLSRFSKILEKIFYTRLLQFYTRLHDFITKHNMLYDHQYGFRRNWITSMALMEFVEEITAAIEQRKYAVGVFLDLKKGI